MNAKPANKPWVAAMQPVKCRGVRYASQSDLARALGVSNATVWKHLQSGTIDRCGLRDGKRLRGNEVTK